jgi:carbonic anhydrase
MLGKLQHSNAAMKNSTFILIMCSLLILACQTNQQAKSKQVDSLQIQAGAKEQSEQQMEQTLTKAGDMVKAESPDAEEKFEQGYALPRMNDGVAQSPINIITFGLSSNAKKRIDLKLRGSIDAVENLGHTIQIDFSEGSITLVDGKSYELKQLHFHTPSEHLIDGITFPMEMHIVSKLNDSIKSGDPTYTVLGILFRMGRENKFLNEFLNTVPKEEGKDLLNPVMVKLNDLLAESSNGEKLTYYMYQGSLTTPPYTESVNWVVAKRIFEASEKQIATIEKLEGNNARHIRALNNRKIGVE